MSIKIKKFAILPACVMTLLLIYCLTRIYRNSFNYDAQTVGGIWNVIILLFSCSGVAVLLFFKQLRGKITFSLLFWFGVLSLAQSVFTMFFQQDLNVLLIYNLLMIPNASFTFAIFYKLRSTIVFSNLILIVYYIIAALVLISQLMFQSGLLSFILIANIYYFLCLFPMAMQVKKAVPFTWIVTLICVLTSNKRTALIAFFIATLAYYFLEAIIAKNVKKRLNRQLKILGIIVAMLLALYVADSVLEMSIIHRIYNSFQDQGSGRLGMYQTVWSAFSNSSWQEKLLGHGFNSVASLLLVHDDAHNDFLQILYEFGIFPCILIILFYVSMVRDLFYAIHRKFSCAPILAVNIVVCFSLSMLSVFFVTVSYSLCSAASLGMVYFDYWKEREQEMLPHDNR